MKIENKKTNILRFEDSNERHTYATLLLLLINAPIKNMTIAEMRKRLDLADILEAGGDVLEFDEEQTVDLRRIWEAGIHVFQTPNRHVVELDDAIKKP